MNWRTLIPMSQNDRKNRSNKGVTMSEEVKSTNTDQPPDDPSRRRVPERGQHEGPVSSASSGGSPDDAVGGEVDSHQGDKPDNPGSTGVEDAADESSVSDRIETMQAEIAEYKDRHLRAVAEVENIRRRADTDVSNARKFAVEGFASEMLAVRDALDIARSLEIAEDDAGAVAKMKEGLDLTLRQMDSAFSKFLIEAVDPQTGDKLDPERHQAMTTQESGKVPPNHIIAVIQKGYTIHGRLLRPAMVVVAKKPQD